MTNWKHERARKAAIAAYERDRRQQVRQCIKEFYALPKKQLRN